ncbi:MAG: LysE family translocator [Pseudomonas sp.]|nr:LysE family translocator [Pseudomonas sp.]
MALSWLLAYALSVFLLIITPGPVVALVINTSLVAGPGRALWTALGSHFASLVLILLAALILTGSLLISPALLDGVSLAGCGYIAWLAAQGLRAPAQPGGPAAGRRSGGVLAGFLVGVSNPKDILFFVAFFPQFIHVTPSFNTSLAVLAGVWVVIDVAILLGYILLMRQPAALKYQGLIARLSALVLLLIALVGMGYAGWGLWGRV